MKALKRLVNIALPFILTASMFAQAFAASDDAMIVKPDVTSNLGEISKMMYGTGIEYSAGGWNTHMLDKRMINMAKQDDIGHIRFPNGTCCLWYMWHDPVKSTEYNTIPILDTDTVVKFCHEIDAETVLQVNTYSYWDFEANKVTKTTKDNVEKAAAYAANWVEYCNAPNNGANPNGGTDWASVRAGKGYSEPYNIKYWELGNEDWVYYTGEEFGKWSDVFAKAMKNVDPKIEIIYQGFDKPDGFYTDKYVHPGNEFNEGMLNSEGDNDPKYLSTHYYFGQRSLARDYFTLGVKKCETYGDGWKMNNPDKIGEFLQGDISNNINYAAYKKLPGVLMNYSLQTKVTNRKYSDKSLGNAGVMFNFKNSTNYNATYLWQENNKQYLRIMAVENGYSRILSTALIENGVNLGDDYYMRIESDNGRIRANAWKTSVQRGAWLIDIEDTTSNQFGYLGLITMPKSTAAFDEINLKDSAAGTYENFDTDNETMDRFNAYGGEWNIKNDGKLAVASSKGDNSVAYWENCIAYDDFTAVSEISGDGKSGVAFGITDEKNYCSVNVESENEISLNKIVDDRVIKIANFILSKPIDLNKTIWTRVKCNAINEKSIVYFKIWNDTSSFGAGEPVEWNKYNFDSIVRGRVGLCNLGEGNAKFDNLSVVRNIKFVDYFDVNNQQWLFGNGDWKYSSGRLLQSGLNTFPSLAYLNSIKDSDRFTIRTRMYDLDYSKDSQAKAGLAFNIKDNGTRYYAVYLSDGTKLVLSKVVNGVETVLSEYKISGSLAGKDVILLHLEQNQKSVVFKAWSTVAKEPETQMEITLPTVDADCWTDGKVGFVAFENSTASFDAFELTNGAEQAIGDTINCSGKANVRRSDLQWVNQKIKESGSNATNYVSEYNHMEVDDEGFYYYYLQNYAQAVLIADWMGIMIEENVAMASFHAAMGPAMFRMYWAYGETGRDDPRRQTSLLAFRMYSKYFGNRKIAMDIKNSPVMPYSYIDGTINIDVVSVYGSVDTNKNTLEIMMVSKDLAEERVVRVDLSGTTRRNTKGAIRFLGADNKITDGNMFVSTDVAISEKEINTDGDFVDVVVPAHSIAEVSIPLD